MARVSIGVQPFEMQVANADGQTHTFSETLAEHEKAVADYRAKMKVRRAEQKAHE
ncbi:MAG: hypothetical protein HZB26_20135 [Candidatus Hydrogenedentes bacterium]|nr:hypothetical protein [Candidatus Hydrogenedentota bacterium]